MEKKILLPKNLPNTIDFVRHAQSYVNLDEWECTKENTSNFTAQLTPEGIQQAAQLKTYLTNLKRGKTTYFASTFLRPQETLRHAINPGEIYIDPRLDEWYKGVFHANYPKTLETKFKHDVQARKRDTLYYHRATFGESQKDVQTRTLGFLNDLAAQNMDRAFIAGHGRSGRILLDILGGKPWSNDGPLHPIKNCEYFKCIKNGMYYTVSSEFKPV